MHALVHVLTERDGGGEKPQVAEVLRSLLDPEGMEGREQDDLLNLFYDEFVHKLARPIAGRMEAGTAPVNGDADAEQEARPLMSIRPRLFSSLPSSQAPAPTHPNFSLPNRSAEEPPRRLKDSETA